MSTIALIKQGQRVTYSKCYRNIHGSYWLRTVKSRRTRRSTGAAGRVFFVFEGRWPPPGYLGRYPTYKRIEPMGAWQYSVNLIPTHGVMRVHCCIPPTIAVPRPTPENLSNIDAICDAMPNYWLGLADSFVTRLETELETWLTETESWSNNARMFGHNDKHDQLSIWRDDDGNLERINMRFSLANPDSNNLSRLLTMPSLTDCLFHGIQSESVYAPTLENWIADMRMSSASRWLRGGDYLDTKMRG